jgi:hypothetical protein
MVYPRGHKAIVSENSAEILNYGSILQWVLNTGTLIIGTVQKLNFY